MNSKTLLLAIFLVALTGLVAIALRGEPTQASMIGMTRAWTGSGHADADAEAWAHWNGDDPPVVPAGCAECHSLDGYLDFLGEDGTPAGVVDSAAAAGSVLSCNGCHNESAHALTAVRFPSEAELAGFGQEAVCMQCHQGRAAGVDVQGAVEGMDEDRPSEDLRFVNIHYLAAGATQMGSEAASGYQYEGATYVGRFHHTVDYDACYECHSPHALDVDPVECSPCHSNVASAGDIRGIKQVFVDYDGDGDAKEGMAGEVAGMQDVLLQAIQSYASEICARPVGYDAVAYPYFFVDTNGDGSIAGEEAARTNGYNAFTPRLLKAAYNYQVVQKDPGAYAHNARYVLQLLYDSLASLGEKVSVDLEGMKRP